MHCYWVFIQAGLLAAFLTSNVKSSAVCPDALKPGDLVIRGRDWTWGNQDSMGVGKVVAQVTPGRFKINWDSGNISTYTYGLNDLHEVQKAPADRKPAPLAISKKVPTKGDRVIRYKDWMWGDQGSGFPGTVLTSEKGMIKVKWDDGTENANRYTPSGFQDIKVASRAEVIEAEYWAHHYNPCCRLVVGDRIQPGKDWSYGFHSPDFVGVVAGIGKKAGWLSVSWNNNSRGTYRCGFNGKFDLNLAKSQEHSFKVGDRIKVSTQSSHLARRGFDYSRHPKLYGNIVDTFGPFGVIEWEDHHLSPFRLDTWSPKFEKAQPSEKSGITRPSTVGVIDEDLKRQLGSKNENVRRVTVIVSFDGLPIQELLRNYSAICDETCRLKDYELLPAILHRNADYFQAEALALLRAQNQKHFQLWLVNQLVVYEATWKLVQDLARAKHVTKIEPDRNIAQLFQTNRLQHRADHESPWGIHNVRADDIWNRFNVRGEGVTVGVIDSGVIATHAELAGKMRYWSDGTRPWDRETDPFDLNGHGTHVTATIVGANVGVAPGAKYIACNLMTENEATQTFEATEAATIACLQFMYCPTDPQGAQKCSERPQIVNNSWGDYEHSGYLDMLLATFHSSGIISVFAVGNNGPACSTVAYPTSRLSFNTIIAVGAIAQNNSVSWGSNRGPGTNYQGAPQLQSYRPDIVAPGVNILSASRDGRYATSDGTSMAAPHVTGTIALWLSGSHMSLDRWAVRGLIHTSARKTVQPEAFSAKEQYCGDVSDSVNPNHVSGYGRLDAMMHFESR